jgi:putative thioredoxin
MQHIPHTTGLIHATDEQHFKRDVLEASATTPVLVDFWADWCAPCRMLTPLLEKLVRAYAGRFQLVTVEVDDNMRLAGHYRLRGFPTVLLFINGEERGRFSGYKPEHLVRAFLDERITAAT